MEGVISIVEAVAQDLRRQLFLGQLPTHEPLTEAGIAEHYEVARPTAKAAIEKLVSEGLLVRGAHRSARVPILDARDAHDIYRTRADIEAIAVRRLAATRTVPDQARHANQQIAALAHAPTLDVVDPDMQFHISLVDAIGSARLSRAYLHLASEVRLCTAQVQANSLLGTTQIHTEHTRLLDQIQAGDADSAITTLEHHLTHAREQLVALLNGTLGHTA